LDAFNFVGVLGGRKGDLWVWAATVCGMFRGPMLFIERNVKKYLVHHVCLYAWIVAVVVIWET
jgi:hypothetical protein